MPIGTKIVVKLARAQDGSLEGVEGVELIKFTHDDGFLTRTDVLKDDVSNSAADRYVVTTFWAADDSNMPMFDAVAGALSPTPPSATTLASSAITAVNNVFPGTFA